MDLKQPVEYRGYDLNGRWRSEGARIYGSQINTANLSAVSAAGYTEKRALDDGRDASDVYLEARRVALAGQVWGESRGEVYDELQNLLFSLSPTHAYAEDPVVKGYLPLTFSRPTTHEWDWPDGMQGLVLYSRPIALPEYTIMRDAMGGEDSKGGTIMWSAMLDCIDPRIYVDEEQLIALSASGSVGSGSGSFDNRGDNYSPLQVHLDVPAAKAAGTFDLIVAGSQLHITIPNSSNDQELDYDGRKKLMYLTESGVTTIRMDLMSLLSGTAHPRIPPGTTVYEWSSTVTFAAGPSYFQYREAFL